MEPALLRKKEHISKLTQIGFFKEMLRDKNPFVPNDIKEFYL